MVNHRDDIERYLRGELSPGEMHALEKKALQDPFLAEALEGAQHAGDSFSGDLAFLNKSIRKKTTKRKRKIISINNRNVYMGIAAGLSLLVMSYYIIVSILHSSHKQELATAKPSLSEPAQKTPVPSSNEPSTVTPPNVKSEEPVPSKTETAKPKEEDEQIPVISPATVESIPEGTTTTGQHAYDAVSSEMVEEQVADKDKKEQIADKKEDLKINETPPEVAKEYRVRAEKRKSVSESGEKVASARSLAAPVFEGLVKGKVTSADDGNPLPGVNVVIKGTPIGTVTDEYGNYQLHLNDAQQLLVFSSIGFKSQEVPVNRPEVNIALSADVSALSEVVVTRKIPGAAEDEEGVTVLEAVPSGGYKAFRKYLQDHMKYPQQAIDKNVQGTVTIQFTVEPDGKLNNFKVVKGIGAGCDEELIRLVREGPLWKPAKSNGQPISDNAKVKLKFELPQK